MHKMMRKKGELVAHHFDEAIYNPEVWEIVEVEPAPPIEVGAENAVAPTPAKPKKSKAAPVAALDPEADDLDLDGI